MHPASRLLSFYVLDDERERKRNAFNHHLVESLLLLFIPTDLSVLHTVIVIEVFSLTKLRSIKGDQR
jgi:hypothetical protein